MYVHFVHLILLSRKFFSFNFYLSDSVFPLKVSSSKQETINLKIMHHSKMYTLSQISQCSKDNFIQIQVEHVPWRKIVAL